MLLKSLKYKHNTWYYFNLLKELRPQLPKVIRRVLTFWKGSSTLFKHYYMYFQNILLLFVVARILVYEKWWGGGLRTLVYMGENTCNVGMPSIHEIQGFWKKLQNFVKYCKFHVKNLGRHILSFMNNFQLTNFEGSKIKHEALYINILFSYPEKYVHRFINYS